MAKTVRDLMTNNPCAIEADKPVAYAAKMMRDEDVGLAPIVEGKKLIGTLTDPDKERAATIANSPGASNRGGKSPGSGSSRSNSRQGGTTAQRMAAGRKGGRATANKS